MPIAVVTAAAPTAGGLPVSQDIIGSFPETPVGAICVVTRCTSVGSIQANGNIARAFTDGTNHRCASMYTQDAAVVLTGHTCGHYVEQTALLVILANGAVTAVEAQADFTAFIAGGIRISWTDLPTAAYQMKWTFFYGEAWQCFVDDYNGHGTVNNSVDVTGAAFRPRGGLACGARDAMATGAGNDGIFMSGAFALAEDGTVEGQWGHTHFEATTPVTTTCVGGGIRDDSIFARISVDPTTGAVTEQCRHEVTAGLSNGITVTTRVGSVAMSGFVMLLRNGDKRFWADVPSVATSSTGDKTVTIGWKPGAIFGVPTGKTTLNGYENTGATCGTFGEVINDGQGGQKGAVVAIEDDVATSDSYNAITNNWNVLNVAAGNDWVGSVTARTATGFTFNISNASAADAFTGFFAVEASFEPPHRRLIQAMASALRATRAGLRTVFRGGAGHSAALKGGQAAREPRPGPGFTPHGGAAGTKGGGGEARAAPTTGRAVPQPRPPIARVSPGGRAQTRSNSVLREITRFRLARLFRLRWKPRPEEPELQEVVDGVPTSPAGSSAMAGSDEGDNAMAGSYRGSSS